MEEQFKMNKDLCFWKVRALPLLTFVWSVGMMPSISTAAITTDPLGFANGQSSLFVDIGNPKCSDSYGRNVAFDPNTPWCNVEPAVTNADLQPGDTIYVRRGTYRVLMRGDNPYTAPSDNCLIVPNASGTSKHPITIKAYDDEDVLIDGRFDIRDHNGDRQLDQKWQQCQWKDNACGSPCKGIPDQKSCKATWYIDYKWTESYPYYANKGQFWQDDQLIPSLITNNMRGFSKGNLWMKDPTKKRIYYRSTNNSNPNNLNITYGGCSIFFSFMGKHNWVVDGIDTIAVTDVGYLIGYKTTYENGVAKNKIPSFDITIQNVATSYDGDNACTPNRDSTYGHGLDISGSSNILIKDSKFSQDVSECIHVSNNCPGNKCGEHFVGNLIYDCGQDPGWDSQCTPLEEFSNETSPGIIVRSDGGIYEDNRFENNDGSAFILESENSKNEGLALPSHVTISRNWFVNNRGAGVEAACVYGNAPSSNNLIANNVFINNSIDYDFMGQLWLSGNCEDYKIYNNTIVNGPYWGIHVTKYYDYDCVWDDNQSGPCEPLRNEIINNVVAGNGYYRHPRKVAEISFCPECSKKTNITHNILFDTSDAIINLGATTKRCNQISEFQSNNLCLDPNFVDLSKQNIHLNKDSLAIDAGYFIAGLNSDIDKDARPDSSMFDIGADEYKSAEPSKPLPQPRNLQLLVTPSTRQQK
jgi:hypothetical protein